MELDFSEEIKASRPGPKSAAQTPSKPEERKKGSSKNEPGSAGTSPESKEKSKKILKRKDDKELVKESKAKITFSEKVTTSLKNKVKEHNKKHSKKVTLGMLKKVYRRGAGAFSGTHRPGQSRASWAMARVNMFLKMMRGGKVKDAYRKADSDIARASEEEILNLPDVFNEWSPGDFTEARDVSVVEFSLAKIDLLAAGATQSEILEGDASEAFEAEAKEKKTLNKPFRLPSGSKKKFGVYVKNDKGNVVKVTFGDPNMEIKRDDPERRKSFRARHQCDTNPGPKYKARYWSCRQWEAGKKVEAELESDASLLSVEPTLAEAPIIQEEE
tara:strand:- start:19172 stop:20158 length:987 start_codon:yes stop_codon:yes gene_type:complete